MTTLTAVEQFSADVREYSRQRIQLERDLDAAIARQQEILAECERHLACIKEGR